MKVTIILSMLFNLREIIVFHDGACPLCVNTRSRLERLDWLRRLRFFDLNDPKTTRRLAPDIPARELAASLHIKLPDGSYRKGFIAFRRLAAYLPLLWPLIPFLYLPGAAFFGDLIYNKVARHRKRNL